MTMLPIQLEAELENQIAEDVADEMVQELQDFVKEVLDSGIPTMRTMPPAERLAHYVQITDARDFLWVMDKDYMAQFQAGLVPALVSPRWLAIMSVPELYAEVSQDFRNVYRTQVVEKMG